MLVLKISFVSTYRWNPIFSSPLMNNSHDTQRVCWLHNPMLVFSSFLVSHLLSFHYFFFRLFFSLLPSLSSSSYVTENNTKDSRTSSNRYNLLAFQNRYFRELFELHNVLVNFIASLQNKLAKKNWEKQNVEELTLTKFKFTIFTKAKKNVANFVFQLENFKKNSKQNLASHRSEESRFLFELYFFFRHRRSSKEIKCFQLRSIGRCGESISLLKVYWTIL